MLKYSRQPTYNKNVVVVTKHDKIVQIGKESGLWKKLVLKSVTSVTLLS